VWVRGCVFLCTGWPRPAAPSRRRHLQTREASKTLWFAELALPSEIQRCHQSPGRGDGQLARLLVQCLIRVCCLFCPTAFLLKSHQPIPTQHAQRRFRPTQLLAPTAGSGTQLEQRQAKRPRYAAPDSPALYLVQATQQSAREGPISAWSSCLSMTNVSSGILHQLLACVRIVPLVKGSRVPKPVSQPIFTRQARGLVPPVGDGARQTRQAGMHG
jgi:hypothetical protein